MTLSIGSLFSGIGGLDLGLERAGLGPVRWQVERDPFCRAVLRTHWPNAQLFDDVRTVGAHNLAPVDVLCGGFPCQDVSSAGKREGLGTEDDPTERSGLWFQFARLVAEVRPRWVIVENVASGAKRWVPRVRRDLWTRGYASVPLGIAACEVGARHRRERVFILAAADVEIGGWDRALLRRDLGSHSASQGRLTPAPSDPAIVGWWGAGLADQPERKPDLARGAFADPARQRVEGGRLPGRPSGSGLADALGDAADPDGPRPPDRQRERGALGEAPGEAAERDPGAVVPWEGLPPRPWVVRELHGLPRGVDLAGWPAGWTPARTRAARIAGLGNAVVPDQVAPVGRLILMLEQARRAA